MRRHLRVLLVGAAFGAAAYGAMHALAWALARLAPPA